MRNYGEIAGEELFSPAHDDLIHADFDLSIAAARMLGRNMRYTLNKYEKLKFRIIQILEGRLMKFSPKEIDQMYIVNDKYDLTIDT